MGLCEMVTRTADRQLATGKSPSALDSLRAAAADFIRWWRGELWAAVPASLRARLAGSSKCVRLSVEDGGYRVGLEDGRGELPDARSSRFDTREDAVVAAGALARRNKIAAMKIVLPEHACFVRWAELPRAVLKDCRRLLDLDLERATPFRGRDVYTAYRIGEPVAGSSKCKVQQFVVKRDVLDPLIAAVTAAGGTVVAADCASAGALAGVDFLEAPDEAGRARRQLTPARLLAGTALALLVAAALQMSWKRDRALSQLREETTAARQQAASVRQALDLSEIAVKDLAKLQAIKLRQVPATMVLEEISRLLPDSAWVTDLRIENDVVDLSGLAASGANLLPLFERSPLFSDASLTAPVTFDQREDKERFSLRVRIKAPGRKLTGAG